MKTITNHHYRPTLYWEELTPKEQGEFDWLETDEERACETFVRYRGSVYALGEFMRNDHLPKDSELNNWDGYHSDSFFSAVVVAFNPEDPEFVKMGLVIS